MRYYFFKSLFLKVLFFTSLSAVAQKSFVPGSVTLNNGKTLLGEIDYKIWDNNPDNINFRDSAGAVKNYSTSDLIAFNVFNKDIYERAEVSRDMRPVNVARLNDLVSDSSRTEPVWLRVLVKGDPVSLYEFIDEKEHYFYQTKSGNIEELQYQVKYSDQNYSKIFYNNSFRNQLSVLYKEKLDEKGQERLFNLNYTRRDLVDFVTRNNNKQSFTEVKQVTNRKAINLFAGVGITYSKISFATTTLGANPLEFTTSVSPAFIVGVDLGISRDKIRTAIRFELSAYSLKAVGTSETHYLSPESHEVVTYTVKQNNITPTFGLIHSFIRKPSYRIFAGANFGIAISSYPVNHYYVKETMRGAERVMPSDDFVAKNWAVYNVQTGVIIKNRVEAGVTVRLGGAFMTPWNTPTNKEFNSSFKLLYRF